VRLSIRPLDGPLPGAEAPVSVADALAEDCAKCGSAVGSLCTYLDDRMYAGYGRVIKHLRGDPMRGFAHKERRQAVRKRRQQAADREQRRLYRERRRQGQAVPASPQVIAAARAMQAHAVTEHMQLRAWWAEHGHIIANADRNPQ
jgi:hypothetical protein